LLTTSIASKPLQNHFSHALSNVLPFSKQTAIEFGCTQLGGAAKVGKARSRMGNHGDGYRKLYKKALSTLDNDADWALDLIY
jgi:hypothetical protein